MNRWCLLPALLLFATAGAIATPYWVSWDASMGYPENSGWSRNWGDWSGQFQGPGAQRTIANGTLTYDSLSDGGVYDINYLDRTIDPGPGEMLVMEWRLNVERVAASSDPTVGVAGDGAWIIGLTFSESAIISMFEDYAATPIVSGMFHDYRLTSLDMRTYDLYIDGELARVGSFWHGISHSHVSWGDAVQSFSGGSLHQWDYFRIGVVPEPAAVTLLGVATACCVGRRR